MEIDIVAQISKQAAQKLNEYHNEQPESIAKQGFREALSLFKEMAVGVPAYKDFLKAHKVNPDLVSSKSDFSQLPIINKQNYLAKYPLSELCWNGSLDTLSIISSSSGSSGKSFLWPRGEAQEIEGQEYIEVMFKDFFEVDKCSTLYINCFSMGTWVAGTYVLSCVERLSWQGHPIISVCPGIEKKLAVQLFEDLAGQFDQIIFGGYPPFIKDILDEGSSAGIQWTKHRIRFLFAAEGFSERWRTHIHQIVGASDPYTTSINIYGSADATILAHETPLTSAIRQFAGDNHQLLSQLFGQDRLPTLTQYDPRKRFFQVAADDQLIFSARAGIPLLRYSIGDTGGCRSFDEMHQSAMSIGYDWRQDPGLSTQVWNLPFVWVFGRSNLATNLYGVLIFPEYIKHGLEDLSVSQQVTGKFVMSTELNNQNDQFLSVDVELAQHVSAEEVLHRDITKAIVNGLKSQSGEYNRLHQSINQKAIPKVQLVGYGSEVFAVNSKHRWVKKAEV